MRGTRTVWSAVFVLLVGCGGSQPPVESPEPPAAEDEATPAEPAAGAPKSEPKPEEEVGPEGGEAKPATAEPAFTDGMSVDEAINAVPQGVERMNLDPDVLGKPLMDPDLYKPCKLSANQHVKIRVAIWEGKAVGIDVTPTPKNQKAADCVKDQIKTVTWKDKVRSLNTVDYAL
jgi:hypothetical protein